MRGGLGFQHQLGGLSLQLWTPATQWRLCLFGEQVKWNKWDYFSLSKQINQPKRLFLNHKPLQGEDKIVFKWLAVPFMVHSMAPNIKFQCRALQSCFWRSSFFKIQWLDIVSEMCAEWIRKVINLYFRSKKTPMWWRDCTECRLSTLLGMPQAN